MPSSYPGSAARRRFGRWEWVAGAAAGALVLWIGSCTLCGDSDDLARKEPGPAEPPRRESPGTDSEIAALRMALNQEIEAREQLAWEVASLREQIQAGSSARRESAERAAAGTPDRAAQRSMFDGNSLVAAGMAP